MLPIVPNNHSYSIGFLKASVQLDGVVSLSVCISQIIWGCGGLMVGTIVVADQVGKRLGKAAPVPET
jgi:hypothetical protein